MQYYYLGLCILVLLPLSLHINGADWSAQFVSWGVSDWAVLVLVSSVVCVGSIYAIQVDAMCSLCVRRAAALNLPWQSIAT